MRDHTKLRAFEMADEVAVLVYQVTAGFPREEMYGLTSQMRRAAVSVPSKHRGGLRSRQSGGLSSLPHCGLRITEGTALSGRAVEAPGVPAR